MTEIVLPKKDAEGFIEFFSAHPTLYMIAERFGLSVAKETPNELILVFEKGFVNILINERTKIEIMKTGSLLINTKLAVFIIHPLSGAVQTTILYELNQ